MMANRKQSVLFVGLAAALFAASSSPVIAGAHTWVVNEVFSNADGTIQFVEILESAGGSGEIGIGGAFIVSNTRSYDIPSNVASPTTSKTVLFGTPAFCALFNQLPGSPTCDFIFPVAQVPFLSTTADNLRYSPYQGATGLAFTAGQLPTDGVNSRTRTGTTGPNTPKNYAGLGGTVNANPPAPAGVPDGTGGSTPMTASRLDAGGTSISVSWDTATCAAGTPDVQIIFGERSNLPGTPGGAFGVTGSVCGLGTASPILWNGVPDAGDGSGLLWWLVVVKQGAVEGSWGDESVGERTGPGAGGSSGQCGVTSRSLSNVCGH